jgi:hypothetical protein
VAEPTAAASTAAAASTPAAASAAAAACIGEEDAHESAACRLHARDGAQIGTTQ